MSHFKQSGVAGDVFENIKRWLVIWKGKIMKVTKKVEGER